MAISDGVTIQALIVIGSVATTYLTVKYKNVLVKKNRTAPPKDRMETIFEGYEKLIVQQQGDIERKTGIIHGLEEIVKQLRIDLDKTTTLLDKAREEVRESKHQNKQMQHQLDVIKSDYRKDKTRH